VDVLPVMNDTRWEELRLAMYGLGADGPRGWTTSSISRAPHPIAISDGVGIGLLVAAELVAIWAVVRIWRDPRRSRTRRAFWTAITLVPLVGLIAYALLCDPPPPNGPTDRPPGRDWDIEP
jgi:hypothetical protein